MSRGIQTFDKLWSYWGPSGPCTMLRVSKRFFSSQHSQTNARIFTTIPQAASWHKGTKVHNYTRRYAHQKTVFGALDLRDQGFMRTLDTETVYHKLRQIALNGGHSQIQACVSILLTERGEKPNVRLYDALLLANVDHEYGSAHEACKLLEEMATEGIAPDSATYHAALKVRIQNLCLARGSANGSGPGCAS